MNLKIACMIFFPVLMNCALKNRTVIPAIPPVPLVYAPKPIHPWPINTESEKLAIRYVKEGSLQIVDSLIISGINLNTRDESNGKTLITLAVEDNRIPVVQYLFQKGADPTIRDNWGNAVCSAALYHRPEIMKIFMDNGINPNTKTNYGDPILLFAVGECHYETIEILIAAGVDVNLKSQQGEYALKDARKMKNERIIEMLLKAGAKDQ